MAERGSLVCLSALAVELEYKANARFLPGPKRAQALLAVRPVMEQVQQLRSVLSQQRLVVGSAQGLTVLVLWRWQGCGGQRKLTLTQRFHGSRSR